MHRIARALLCAFLAAPLAAIAASAESHDCSVRVWQTDSGLPEDSVRCIAQDRDGYLWCGTYNGLVRFDGADFKSVQFSSSPNPLANRVLALLSDREGALWVGTDGAGLFRISHGGVQCFQRKDGLCAEIVLGLAEDPSGGIWIGTSEGLNHFAAGLITSPGGDADGPLAREFISQLCYDSEGRLWIAAKSKVLDYENGRFVDRPIPDQFRNIPLCICAGQSGSVWVGQFNGSLLGFSGGGWSASAEPARFGNAQSVICSKDGELWIGTSGGLCRYARGVWSTIPIPTVVSNPDVLTVYEDREGSIWVGTQGGGLAQVRRNKVTMLDAQMGLRNAHVQALLEGEDGKVMAGMRLGGLMEGTIHGGFADVFDQREFDPKSSVWTLMRARDGALWVGSFGQGLQRFGAGPPVRYQPAKNSPAMVDQITALITDRAGEVWVGTYQGLYTPEGQEELAPVDVLGQYVRLPVSALLEDLDGTLWAGYFGYGIVHFAGGNATHFGRSEGLPTDFVRTLYQDKSGVLWIGTEAGLSRKEGNTLFTYTMASGLPDNRISQILEDDDANLWLGTSNGIMRLKRSDLDAARRRRDAQIPAFSLGLADGLTSVECTGGYSPAGLKTRSGQLWFATTNGIAVIDPKECEPSHEPARTFIESVQAGGRRTLSRSPLGEAQLGFSKLIEFSSHTRNIEFRYTSTLLSDAEKVRFKHRLVGFDDHWSEPTASRTISYAYLPPGKYRFEVMARNLDGKWGPRADPVIFSIARPPWQNPWLLGLESLAAIGVITAFIRFFSYRRLRDRLRVLEAEQAIARERHRIAQDIHDEVGSKLSRLSFLSDLAVQEGKVENNAARQQFAAISETARDSVRALDEIVWAANPRHDTLQSLAHYICRYAEEFFEGSPIECRFHVDHTMAETQLPPEVRHGVFLSTKEVLSNVLKHSKASRVEIRVTTEGAMARVEISDNGRGFDCMAAAPRLQNRNHEREGNGLANLRSPLASLGGECLIDSEPGAGVRIVLQVPWSPVQNALATSP